MRADIIIADPRINKWLAFNRPIRVIQTYKPSDVPLLLADVERWVNKKRCFAAGYISYEAASGFDPNLVTKSTGVMPVAFFGLYDSPAFISKPYTDSSVREILWQNLTGERNYRQALKSIREQIAIGSTYQVNYTVRLMAEAVDPWELFCHLSPGGRYSSYIDSEDFSVISASPELFFSLDSTELTSEPMKGTASRGLTLEEDLERHDWLKTSEKNRAENLMITDMVRNDLGKIARPGSVKVVDLYRINKFPTVWQAVSEVIGDTDASLVDVFGALFPGASVTGAPKKASMNFISSLESSPREIYTGTIGYFGPDRRAQFNIAIRTAWIDKKREEMSYGVGGGIVWDSDPDEELEEISIKSRVLYSSQSEDEFLLLETMRWNVDGGILHLPEHLNRLLGSAEYFSFNIQRVELQSVLDAAISKLEGQDHRIRLTVARDGEMKITTNPIVEDLFEPELVLARNPIDANNRFLYHKTTNRKVYKDAELIAQRGQEVLLYNAQGYVTESTIANIVFGMDGAFFTPPIKDGLLPGTMRARLLKREEISERRLSVKELDKVSSLFLVNSLRGWRRARLKK